jgi:hypothetical protein
LRYVTRNIYVFHMKIINVTKLLKENSFIWIPALIVFLFVGSNLSLYAGTISVTYPNGGEILKNNDNVEIKWTSAGIPGKVVILLYKKGIMQAVISDQVENTGSFQWNISPGIPAGNDYRIRIRSLDDLSVNDFSDHDFTIKN